MRDQHPRLLLRSHEGCGNASRGPPGNNSFFRSHHRVLLSLLDGFLHYLCIKQTRTYTITCIPLSNDEGIIAAFYKCQLRNKDSRMDKSESFDLKESNSSHHMKLTRLLYAFFQTLGVAHNH